MGCLDAAIPEQLLRRPDVNCLQMDTEKPAKTTFVCLEPRLFTCMDQLSRKQTQLSSSVTFSTSRFMTQLPLRVDGSPYVC